jgi:hypothetical protein
VTVGLGFVVCLLILTMLLDGADGILGAEIVGAEILGVLTLGREV